MGNQLAKQQDSQKKYRLVNISRSRSIINDHRSNNGSSSSSSSTPTPVRHQVVISDSTSKTIPLLSSSSTRRRIRQHTSHNQRYDTHSLSSLNTSDDEPGTPTAAAAANQQPLNSLDASTTTTTTSSLVDGWPSNYHMNPSTMIVFDSAIASAENAAEDNRKRRDSAGTAVTQKQKNTQLYEYGEEKEYNRQLRQHYVLKRVFGGNAHVSLDGVRDVLECACGTGLWAFEMAQVLAPQSRIIGIDLVPPTNERSGLPTQSIPANVTYKRGDILAPLDFADQQFDYIYQRDVAHVVPKKHWPSLIREFHRVLRAGGKLELVEYDMLFKNPGPVLALVNEWYKLAAATIGVDPNYADSLGGYLKEAGFEDIDIQVYDIPIGEWPSNPVQRQYGFLYKEQMKSLFKSMKRWWLSELQVSEVEYDRVCLAALDEFEDYRCIAKWKIITAKKKEAVVVADLQVGSGGALEDDINK
ncbi:methyltransferase type 11 [Lichtheimia corymbifera JMRC:FSU:9682]|uniref:Methyltransferase type 11 n=1 Tax=Lichtheimia corymbifera JMRC:FSU:9682 TaxID=1263082 RepID=A0A068S457_9FUNG|nr:methyltransferase type 11 [Lichtheimia corymbifera JMRC:FSU:9682]